MHPSRVRLLAVPPLLGALLAVPVAASAAPSTDPVGTAQDDAGAECAAYASAHAVGHDWVCVGSSLTERWQEEDVEKVVYTDVRSLRSVDVTGLPPEAAERAVEAIRQAVARQATPPSHARQRPPGDEGSNTSGDLSAQAIIDSSHAKNTEYIYWTLDGHSGKTNFTYSIGLHNHSANVDMSYFETSGVGIKLSWRLRIRHDISGAPDSTLFSYPDVHGPWYYTQSYTAHEDRYGDGFDRLPYETGWKVFWDSNNIELRYGGASFRTFGTLQSDRATCYRTVPCKFI